MTIVAPATAALVSTPTVTITVRAIIMAPTAVVLVFQTVTVAASFHLGLKCMGLNKRLYLYSHPPLLLGLMKICVSCGLKCRSCYNSFFVFHFEIGLQEL